MKTKYTPGKWKVEVSNQVAKIVTGNEHVASCYAETEECKANAKLIAEAPITIARLIHTNDYLKLLTKNKLIPEGTRVTIKELIFWNDKSIKEATL